MNWKALAKKSLLSLPFSVRRPVLLARKRLFRSEYQQWLKTVYPLLVEQFFEFENKELPMEATAFSLITLVHNPRVEHFKKCVESVLDQAYWNFEWIIIDNATTSKPVLKLLERIKSISNFRVIRLEKNIGITKGTELAAEVAKGPWLCFLDHDDKLDSSALLDFAKVAALRPEVSFIYSDHDHCDDAGWRHTPILKPEPSLEYLLGVNYICHFHALKKNLYLKLKVSNTALDGAQDWDITLKAIESKAGVYHIPKILYTYRIHPEQYSFSQKKTMQVSRSQREALLGYMRRHQLESHYRLENVPGQDRYYIQYSGHSDPAITLLSPELTDPKWEDSLLKSIKAVITPYFAFTHPYLTIETQDWLQQAIGLFKRETDVALQGGKVFGPTGAVHPTVIVLAPYNADLVPFGEPPEVRREVSALSPTWWIGRADIFQRVIPRLQRDPKVPLGLQLCKLLRQENYRIIYDPLLVGNLSEETADSETHQGWAQVHRENHPDHYHSPLLLRPIPTV